MFARFGALPCAAWGIVGAAIGVQGMVGDPEFRTERIGGSYNRRKAVVRIAAESVPSLSYGAFVAVAAYTLVLVGALTRPSWPRAARGPVSHGTRARVRVGHGGDVGPPSRRFRFLLDPDGFIDVDGRDEQFTSPSARWSSLPFVFVVPSPGDAVQAPRRERVAPRPEPGAHGGDGARIEAAIEAGKDAVVAPMRLGILRAERDTIAKASTWPGPGYSARGRDVLPAAALTWGVTAGIGETFGPVDMEAAA